MKKLLLSAMAVLSAAALSACGGGNEGPYAGQTLHVYNWGEYTGENIIGDFEEETGATVVMENFDSNEQMYIKAANGESYDILVPSDYMIQRLIQEDYLQKLDKSKLDCFDKLSDEVLGLPYDPNNDYSVPYFWGTVGIVYDKTKVDIEDLEREGYNIFLDEKYKGDVYLYDSERDSFMMALKALGYSMNTRDPVALEAAKQKLIEQKQSGVVKAYQVDETKDKMVAGEAALAVMWSGDAQYAIDLNPDLAYAIPKEGSNVWVDCMVIPKTAKNKENAEAFINFLCRPDIAQKNCEAIWYSTPNTEAIKLMGEEYTSNTTMNPSAEDVANCEYFHDIQDFIAIYNALWQEVKNAK